MAIGPVQLIVLGFSRPDFHGEIIAELERLRENDTIRVIDSLAVYKDADGELEVEHLSNLSEQEAIEYGTKIGALIGLGIEGEDGIEAGAAAAPRRSPRRAVWRSSPRMKPGMCWGTYRTTPRRRLSSSNITGRCRCATRSCGPGASGISDGFISLLDLVDIGLGLGRGGPGTARPGDSRGGKVTSLSGGTKCSEHAE